MLGVREVGGGVGNAGGGAGGEGLERETFHGGIYFRKC